MNEISLSEKDIIQEKDNSVLNKSFFSTDFNFPDLVEKKNFEDYKQNIRYYKFSEENKEGIQNFFCHRKTAFHPCKIRMKPMSALSPPEKYFLTLPYFTRENAARNEASERCV